jgi:hypothetical protein
MSRCSGEIRIASAAQPSRLELVGEFNGDGLHGRLWGVAREVKVMGGCTKGYGGYPQVPLLRCAQPVFDRR